MMISIVLILFVSLCSPTSTTLPSYIKACHKSDPDFDSCAVKSANEAIPIVRNGDRKYKIPVMDPLEIETMEVNDGGPSSPARLYIVAKQVKIIGLGDGRLIGSHYDFGNEPYLLWNYISPKVSATAKYNVSGQVLVLPIRGQGDMEVSFENLGLNYKIFYEREKRDDGFEYGVVKDTILDYNMTGAHINLDNLFNGNKELGETVNTFLNANWRDSVKAIGPLISEAINQVFTQIVKDFVSVVPLDDIFPE